MSCLGLTVRGHIAKGIASGFPPCCIVYFLVRIWGMVNIRKINEICSAKHAKHQEKYGERLQHIMCPYHNAMYAKNDYLNIPYYTCKRCGWYQYKDKTCNLCGRACEIQSA
jgi:hypothetical protein